MRLDGATLLAEAMKHEGASYVWGAKGANYFDCSGLVTHCLWAIGGPDWRYTHDAARMASVLEPLLLEVKVFGEMKLPLDAPAGALAFYGPPGKANHVMLCVGDGRVFGACGGGPQTVAPQKGACVQYRPSLRYRPDFLGLRRLPEARTSHA